MATKTRKKPARRKAVTRRTVKKAAPKRTVSRKRKRTVRKNTGSGQFGERIRPVVVRTASGWKRPKRSKWAKGKKVVRVNPKRKSRRTRRNPITVKRLFSQQNLMTALSIGGGFVAGGVAMPFVYTIVPEKMQIKARPFLGAIHVLLGSIVSMASRNRMLRQAGIGIAASGVYDLVAVNVPQIGLIPLPTASALATSALPSASESEQSELQADYNPARLSANYETMGANYETMGAISEFDTFSGLGHDEYDPWDI